MLFIRLILLLQLMPQKTMSACYAFMDKQSVRVSSVKQKYSAILQHQQEQMEVSTTSLQFSIQCKCKVSARVVRKKDITAFLLPQTSGSKT